MEETHHNLSHLVTECYFSLRISIAGCRSISSDEEAKSEYSLAVVVEGVNKQHGDEICPDLLKTQWEVSARVLERSL